MAAGGKLPATSPRANSRAIPVRNERQRTAISDGLKVNAILVFHWR